MARAIASRCRWPPDSITPALADVGVVALRQPRDELVRRRGAGRRLDLGVARLRPAEADVLARRGGEDHRLLRHQRELPPQVGARHLAQVDAVERDPARVRVEEAHQELEDRGLARARRPDQRHRLARRDPQVEAVERRRLGRAG